MNRVFITGMGAVTAHGAGKDALWQGAKSGISGMKPLSFERGIGAIQTAAVFPDFVAEDFLSAETVNRLDRFSHFGLIAAMEALGEAGFAIDQPLGPNTAVIVGTGIGGSTTFEDGCYNLFVNGKRRVNPLTVPKVMANAAACHIGMMMGATGPSFAVSSACSSANQAIGLAAMLIRSGSVERAITGGSETMISSAVMRAWESMRVMTPDATRPFSRGRNGMLLGEGAGILVLESERAMEARGGEPMAELLGYGTTSDAEDLLRPNAESAARAMRIALQEAGLEPQQIDFLSAHGTGTVLNDVTEAAAIGQVFGDHAKTLAVTSTKPIHGHCLGASPALELIITVEAMREGWLPPTINWLEADPKCPLNIIANEGRPAEIRYAASNSFAFGGINAVVVVGRAN